MSSARGAGFALALVQLRHPEALQDLRGAVCAPIVHEQQAQPREFLLGDAEGLQVQAFPFIVARHHQGA